MDKITITKSEFHDVAMKVLNEKAVYLSNDETREMYLVAAAAYMEFLEERLFRKGE